MTHQIMTTKEYDQEIVELGMSRIYLMDGFSVVA